MDRQFPYPSGKNEDIVQDFKNYVQYKEDLIELRDNEHNITCDKCKISISLKIQECKENDYKLNIDAYTVNPFFLGYSSKNYKGVLVHGKLLTDTDIQFTERYEFDFNITAKEGTTICIPYNNNENTNMD